MSQKSSSFLHSDFMHKNEEASLDISIITGPKNLVMEDGHKSLFELIENRMDQMDVPFAAGKIEKVNILLENLAKFFVYSIFKALI